MLEPVKELNKVSKKQKNREIIVLDELEKSLPSNKSVEIDLTSMLCERVKK